MAVTFDGANRTITLPVATPAIDVKIDLYSDWKEWVKLSDNAKYAPAFRVVGGDPTSATQNVAGQFFLRNDLGWTIIPADENAEVTLNGNIRRQDLTKALFDSVAARTILIEVELSAQALEVATGDGFSPTQDARLIKIERILANRFETDPVTGIMTIYADDGVTPLFTAALWEDVAGGIAYRGKGADRRDAI